MKKQILFLLVCLLLPISVYAKCNIISGVGYTSGSELSCGDRHFHVLSSDGKTIKLLADNTISVGIKFNEYSMYVNNYKNNYKDIIIKDSIIVDRLNNYKNSLIDDGIDVIDIKLPTFKDIDEFVRKVQGGYLPKDFNGDLYDYLGNKYSYIWENPFSLRTLKNNELLYINNKGEIKKESIEDNRFYIRPIIEIPIREIQYRIDVMNMGDGVVRLDKEIHFDKEEVTFEVIPRDGLKLDKVEVFDSNGNKLEVEYNSFKMPKSDVLIKAYYIADKNQQIELSNNINNRITKNIDVMIIVSVLGFIIVGYLVIDLIVKK